MFSTINIKKHCLSFCRVCNEWKGLQMKCHYLSQLTTHWCYWPHQKHLVAIYSIQLHLLTCPVFMGEKQNKIKTAPTGVYSESTSIWGCWWYGPQSANASEGFFAQVFSHLPGVLGGSLLLPPHLSPLPAWCPGPTEPQVKLMAHQSLTVLQPVAVGSVCVQPADLCEEEFAQGIVGSWEADLANAEPQEPFPESAAAGSHQPGFLLQLPQCPKTKASFSLWAGGS